MGILVVWDSSLSGLTWNVWEEVVYGHLQGMASDYLHEKGIHSYIAHSIFRVI